MSAFKEYVITGIGTDVGKTVVSAIVSQALQGGYWKPVQAGDLDNSDSIKIKNLTDGVEVLEEAYKLNTPMSPHGAARIDGVEITHIDKVRFEGNLVIEGAGGLLVPLNNQGLVLADIFEAWRLPTIVVSRHYLGSINHTLMTLEILKSRNIEVAGIIFVGDELPSTEEIILSKSRVKMLARIPEVKEITKEFIQQQADKLLYNL